MLWAVSRKARLFFLGILVGVVVQTGTLRSIDTVRRLQWTRSMWTDAPEVTDVWPAHGAMDSSGRLHAWWGVGQSLSFLPFDMLSVAIARTLGVSAESHDRAQRAVVGPTYYPLVTACCLVAAYWWLLGMGFTASQSTFGSLGLLFGTTLLYWTHGAQENSLMLLCALGAAGGAAHWCKTGRLRPAALSAAGLGYSLLIRPQAFAVAGLIVGITMLAFHANVRRLGRDVVRSAVVRAILILVAFALTERVVHYWRFHEVWGTVFRHYDKLIAAHPELPPGWPLNVPFLEGFAGQLWSRFSVFLFDPLLLLPLLLWAFRKPAARPIVVMTIGLAVTLLLDAAAHSNLDFWYGGISWGPRYITVPSEMIGALAAALLAAMWPRLSRAQRAAAVVLVAAAVAIQFSSVLLDDSLEEVQNIAGRPIVLQRFINLWHFFSTNDVTGLGWPVYPGGTPHLTLFPWLGHLYLGAKYGVLAMGVWLCLLAAALWMTARIVRSEIGAAPPKV